MCFRSKWNHDLTSLLSNLRARNLSSGSVCVLGITQVPFSVSPTLSWTHFTAAFANELHIHLEQIQHFIDLFMQTCTNESLTITEETWIKKKTELLTFIHPLHPLFFFFCMLNMNCLMSISEAADRATWRLW